MKKGCLHTLNAFRLIVWGGIELRSFFIGLLLLFSGRTVFVFAVFAPSSLLVHVVLIVISSILLDFGIRIASIFPALSIPTGALNACRIPKSHPLGWHEPFGDYTKRDFNYRAHFNSSFACSLHRARKKRRQRITFVIYKYFFLPFSIIQSVSFVFCKYWKLIWWVKKVYTQRQHKLFENRAVGYL